MPLPPVDVNAARTDDDADEPSDPPADNLYSDYAVAVYEDFTGRRNLSCFDW